MNIKSATMLFVGTIIITILGYDTFAYLKGGQDATVSNVIIEWSHDYPAFTFMVGFAMGHLFWQMKKQKPTLPE